jgi:hypothetical protein
VRLSPLGTSATSGPILPAPYADVVVDDDNDDVEYGAVYGIGICRGI